MMGEIKEDFAFKQGDVVEIRGNCYGERKINAEEFTKF